MKNIVRKGVVALFLLPVMMISACSGGPKDSTISQNSGNSPTSKKSSANQEFKITIDENFEGGQKSEQSVPLYGKVAKPAADPVRAGYTFMGWYTETNGAHFYDFDAEVLSDIDIKAFWHDDSKNQKEFIFEAELAPNITEGAGMSGNTYSGSTQGKGLIATPDTPSVKDYKSNNDYWVHFLYATGNTVIMDIEADKADNDAMIFVRLSMEYRDNVVINPTKYPIKLNDVSLDYGEFTFINVPEQGAGALPFTDYILALSATLKQGTNRFEFVTANSEHHLGTAMATAPMIDCLKIYSTSELSFPTANYDNLVVEDE